MPKYIIESPSGQTLEIEGDTPPTEKELDDIFASEAPKNTPAPVAPTVQTAPQEERTLSSLARLPGQIWDKIKTEESALDTVMREKGVQALSKQQFSELVALKFARKAGEEVFGKAEGLAERSVPPALGQFIGRILPGGPKVWGGLGGAGGEIVAEMREGGPVRPGAVLAAGISGATTGKPLAGEAPAEVLKEAGKFAASNLAGYGAEVALDDREFSPMEALARAGSGAAGAPASRVLSVETPNPRYLEELRDQSFRDVRKWNIVVPPHEMGRGSDSVASFAGKQALQQEAAKRNQAGWQMAVREELNFPDKRALPITKRDLEDIRYRDAAPYREIENMKADADRRLANLNKQLDDRLSEIKRVSDPHEVETLTSNLAKETAGIRSQIEELQKVAAADVRELQKARQSASDARKRYFNGDTTAYEPWQAAQSRVEQLDAAIDEAARISGRQDLPGRLAESRKKIAQSYSVQDSLVEGSGFVDPVVFGRQLDQGVPLSGNLDKIAKFQQAFNREAVEAGRVGAPGAGNINALANTSMASRGDAPGLIGAAVNMTFGRAARPLLLSDYVQAGLLTPETRQGFSEMLARFVTENALQQITAPDTPAPAATP